MVTYQLRQEGAAHKSLPLNKVQRVGRINALPIPCWTYGGMFLGDKQPMS